MGTNFYFMTKNKDFAHKHFAVETDWGVIDEEYEITDIPYLGYEIHLNKLSIGWRPLFQKHKDFDTWNKLEQFYLKHKDNLDIYDEYGEKYEWESYKERIFNHAARKPEPLKWYYGVDPIFGSSTRKVLYHDRCSPEEADFWIPIDHVQYEKTEEEARRKFGIYDYPSFSMEYWNDPSYPIDWVKGDFR